MLRVQVPQFGQQPGHHVVFLDAFQHMVFGLRTASRAVG
jgi:hypothetical protein